MKGNLIDNDPLVSSIFAAAYNVEGNIDATERLRAVVRAGQIADAYLGVQPWTAQRSRTAGDVVEKTFAKAATPPSA